MQLIMAGVTPNIPQAQAKAFNNVCPQCAHTKATQRPASSQGRSSKGVDFKIKKGGVPAGMQAIKKRQIFEQEQQEFIQDMKA